MNTLTRVSEVVFQRPFRLNGLDGLQPAGIYKVETCSEFVDTRSYVSYRYLSTMIVLHDKPPGSVRSATINPAELKDALHRDAAEV